MKTSDFKKGKRVAYIPNHNNGNKDYQYGVVSSINDTYVFVKYDNADCKMITGDEPYTAQATLPENLMLLN